MKKPRKTAKILVISNIILLAIMLLFCYQNADLDFQGVCDECSTGTIFLFYISKIFTVIQIVVAIIMCLLLRINDEAYKYVWICGVSNISMIFAFLQIGIFAIIPGAQGHDDFVGDALVAATMMEIQIVAAMFINVILIAICILLKGCKKRIGIQLEEDYE